MTDLSHPRGGGAGGARARGPGLVARLALQPWFHRMCARVPGLRGIARAEGAALFEIVSGFVRAQTLGALVETGVLERLATAPMALPALAHAGRLPEARAAVLMQAGAALGLVAQRRGLWRLTARGAAFLTVPGLAAMVRHHPVLYGDLADPAAFFRGETEPALARFWPYVFGAGAAGDPDLAARYSQLMADSQGLVAEDTLRLVSLRGVRHLMDVGGGTGAFLAAVARAYPALRLTLFDLPAVVAAAGPRLAAIPAPERAEAVAGSFRDDALPAGADAISLVRVLYDHSDATVTQLLRAVHAALPPGGRIVVSEPMSGGARPDPATDVYFAVYTLAMQTGRTRSGAEVGRALAAAGFEGVREIRGLRPYVTSVVEARRALA
jgi:demethylspheroidene O-methyltransferase